jgi:hypothetical protein
MNAIALGQFGNGFFILDRGQGNIGFEFRRLLLRFLLIVYSFLKE